MVSLITLAASLAGVSSSRQVTHLILDAISLGPGTRERGIAYSFSGLSSRSNPRIGLGTSVGSAPPPWDDGALRADAPSDSLRGGFSDGRNVGSPCDDVIFSNTVRLDPFSADAEALVTCRDVLSIGRLVDSTSTRGGSASARSAFLLLSFV